MNVEKFNFLISCCASRCVSRLNLLIVNTRCKICHVKLKQDLQDIIHSNSECRKYNVFLDFYRKILFYAGKKKEKKTNKSSHFSLRQISREQLEGARLIPMKHVRFYGRGGRKRARDR